MASQACLQRESSSEQAYAKDLRVHAAKVAALAGRAEAAEKSQKRAEEAKQEAEARLRPKPCSQPPRKPGGIPLLTLI